MADEDPCKEKADKAKQTYDEYQRKREDEVGKFFDSVMASGAATAACMIPPWVQCAIAATGAIYVDEKCLFATLERREAAGEANGAYADWLLCVVRHAMYYKK